MTAKRIIYTVGFTVVLVALLYHYVLIMFIAQRYANSAQSTFISENAKLGDLPKRLGLAPRPVTKTCSVTKNMHFGTQLLCMANENYVSIGGINSQRVYVFTPGILADFNKNGWVVDNKTEYKNADNKLVDVAYHRNIGLISCNFKLGSSSGTIYINYYYCSQKVTLPDLNLRVRTFGV